MSFERKSKLVRFLQGGQDPDEGVRLQAMPPIFAVFSGELISQARCSTDLTNRVFGESLSFLSPRPKATGSHFLEDFPCQMMICSVWNSNATESMACGCQRSHVRNARLESLRVPNLKAWVN